MSKYIKNSVWMILFLLVVMAGVFGFYDRQYYLISFILCILSIGMFYFKYDQRKPQTRELVILSVMVTLIVLGRTLFIMTPSFKPTLALIIIYGSIFGKTSGFVCGSLSAFISNFIFGQGPWTPFQMLACGLIGYFSGSLKPVYKRDQKLIFMCIYGIFTGALYSMIMDVWSVLALEGIFNVTRYVVSLIASIPVMFIYILSNIVFINLLAPIMTKKMGRIKLKYGLEERENDEKN